MDTEGRTPRGVDASLPGGAEIVDIKEGVVAARVEKPILALVDAENTEAENDFLRRLAARHGERAALAYRTERAKNPAERLLSLMDRIGIEMRAEGLEQDAVIAEKVRARFDRYMLAVRENKSALETQRGRRVSVADLLRSHTPVRNAIPVTHQVGKNGGMVYRSDGYTGLMFDESGDLKSGGRPGREGYEAEGFEVVDFGFSEEGKSMFYRGLGILKEDQAAIDLISVWEKAAGGKSRLDPKDFFVSFSLEVSGVVLEIRKNPTKNSAGAIGVEERLQLTFSAEFLETALARE